LPPQRWDSSAPLSIPRNRYGGIAEAEADEISLEVDIRLNLTNPADLDMGTWNPNAVTVHNGLVYATDLAADKIAKMVQLKQNSVGAIFARFARALAFDWFLASLYVGGVSHETFGHVAAGRRYGKNMSQNFVPPHFGGGSSDGSVRLTPEQDVYSTGIGPEVTSHIGFLLTKSAMQKGQLRYNHSIFVVDTLLDVINYVLFESPIWLKPSHDDFRGDPGTYYSEMNNWRYEKLKQEYGILEVVDKKLWDGTPGFSWNSMEWGAGLSLLNLPIHLYNIGRYIATGKKNVEMPFIWPHYSFMLSPGGPKSRLDLFIRLDSLNGVVFDPHYSMTLNDSHEDRSYSFGLDVSNVDLDFGKWAHFTVGASFDVWKRPEGWGGAGSGEVVYSPKVRLGPFDSFGLGVSAICKTHGHLFGEILEEGCTVRSILKFEFETGKPTFR